MSKAVKVGKVVIGKGYPVSIQSMTNTRTTDVDATVKQIRELVAAGCEIVRVAVANLEGARSIREIKQLLGSDVPIVADVHYDHRLAIEAIKNGADKVRINPGNINQDWKIRELVQVAKEYSVPIRVGANSGSLRKEFEQKYDRITALGESALYEVRLLEKFGFFDIVISVKSTDVLETIKANEYVASKVEYPLHIGLTEAGVGETAIVKSSIAIGHLLLKGIGNTVRVSIAGDPIKEVIVARKILASVGLRKVGQVIACPTCGRCEIDVEKIAKTIEPLVEKTDLTVAVMGCIVNGVGEGRHADIGVAGTRQKAVIFESGKILKTIAPDTIVEELTRLIQQRIKTSPGS
ncbi:MAG: 4-hydroxy-3-methylbut-2-en-1-yl diphosphate synthase [Thermotoga sp. 50_1627]|uniref:flavodoxin-dependent (E)-4-hydroxy-3-methylbut-2-enyl-diphosphate synthase n=1 Tax=Pseudothermotoga sp. TaxID=2033661 RepID=UPI00076CD882|nr:MAG: 4-hydroxy-3-methylbut-2-en-1-yl diphosphate synthase [Thermotoga sp. 50_64]KUK25350.1 MAG: 4-hydroxy-3-methylbut-2-en-1-yl diphosphate synthase [Thermotoga sp. 50_1627]MBC7115873.1 flavodoxin-dependent (E)-4-hydroxy-3-methylbut-2-enyl-diphosphate synthase [Pseudothermotoga sp.]MBC7122153.1 flavodoxin-dependent (E)-4-hydroxy-3-methylbut-2-enyl-diphosphate synthase [Pseudothermotoga sp.]HBT39662.1 4-hydroxy-3-methylbut-2-en-1-yl diphosphate synthase [Pseudothermotoga sp.]